MKTDFVTNSLPGIGLNVERVLGSRNERLGGRIGPESLPPLGHEECLVVDDRASVRPAEVVETKLTRLLKDASLPVSHLQLRGLLRAR
jgi:hypothetical protein